MRLPWLLKKVLSRSLIAKGIETYADTCIYGGSPLAGMEQTVRTLIIDDEEMSRTLLVTFLQQFGTCDEAVDGCEALELFDKAVATAPYDLVCLDIYMPNLDGQQTLLELRKLEKAFNAKRSKIFIVSSSRSRDDLTKALQGKCDDFIRKPFQPQELLRLLKTHGLDCQQSSLRQ